MILLEGRGLSKAFPIEGGLLRRQVGSVQALQDVSFHIDQGETLALVGGSGCGKSTLAKIVVGLLSPDNGELFWKTQPWSSFGPIERARHAQMIFQDPFASLNPKLSIGTQLGEVFRISGLNGNQVAEESTKLMEAVGLSSEALKFYPFQFSGGQRQRIAIARALALKPELLVADEPLSALDVSIQSQILELFKTLKTTLRLTMLFITHDLAVASVCADRVLVLQDGRLIEAGPTAEVLRHPRQPYTQALLDAVPALPC